MDINKLSFITRKRTPWQVFDFCQLMVKTHFLNLFKITILLYLPIAILAWQIFSLTTASYIIWWLKPLLERPLLDYLAKQSFSQSTTAWGCIKSIKHLTFSDIFAMLTYRRFSPNRAYLAPVEQLEKLRGNARNQRKSILVNRNNPKQTFWLIFCIHIEMLLTFLFIAVSYNFIPQGINVDLQLDNLNELLIGFEYLYLPSYLLAIILVAPYFVTGGFLMYLNSRINLEAWDIELAFKKMATKATKAASISAIVFAAVLMLPSHEVYAQESLQQSLKQEIAQQTPPEFPQALTTQTELEQAANLAIREQVARIYQEHEFIEKVTTWRPVAQESEQDFDLKWLQWLKDFFTALGALSDVIGYIFWLLIALLALWLGKVIYYSGVFSGLTGFNMRKPTASKLPSTELPSFIRNVNQEQWPDDLLQAAKQAIAKQELRQALTLTLKFALSFAQQQSRVDIFAHMTEGECERALLSSLPQQWHASYQQLFHLWIQLAWAHRPVNAEDVQNLIEQFKTIAQSQETA